MLVISTLYFLFLVQNVRVIVVLLDPLIMLYFAWLANFLVQNDVLPDSKSSNKRRMTGRGP